MTTKQDFEYAIKWENLRASYFRAHGQPARADQCSKTLNELQWRVAMIPSADQNEALCADGFVNSEWSTASEPLTNAGWHKDPKDLVTA